MQLPDRLVERIYDASVLDAAWSDVVPAIADLCGARSAVILVNDRVTGELSFADEFGVGTEYRRAYLQDLRQDDLRLDDLVQQPLGTVRTDTMIPRYAAYRQSRAYRELYKKLGTEHALGAFIFSDGRRSYGLRVFRSENEGAFGSAEIERYQGLLPHLARVFRIRSLHQRERDLASRLQHVLDVLPWGICLVDEDGALAAHNGIAKELLFNAERPLATKVRRLAGEALSEWRVSGRQRQVSVLRVDGRNDQDETARLHVLIEVIPENSTWTGNAEPLVMVVLATPAPDAERQAENLAALYDLTCRERAVARHLLSGQRIAATAELLDIAFETARSHLRSIFAKTGVSRQTDLVRIGLSTPAIAGSRPPESDLIDH
ncbi:helix-turn-helix transcriptional regulator [Oceanibacterium hippocampi]|uniref:Bacterial regulatory proteins, luxR family n=1 Tax=Oceanibacterium hippocampi TaxID=745714 RepID=A0A1Y5TVJ2_9PROT|nr:helix-turn-helix transcriptional regulator [Oceanibacterium hippocampi]SLN73072.1 Bacterial regulatory proteins, luxR family [Oceanibacterium hippocampi]